MPSFRLRIRGRLYAGFMALVLVGLVILTYCALTVTEAEALDEAPLLSVTVVVTV